VCVCVCVCVCVLFLVEWPGFLSLVEAVFRIGAESVVFQVAIQKLKDQDI